MVSIAWNEVQKRQGGWTQARWAGQSRPVDGTLGSGKEPRDDERRGATRSDCVTLSLRHHGSAPSAHNLGKFSYDI